MSDPATSTEISAGGVDGAQLSASVDTVASRRHVSGEQPSRAENRALRQQVLSIATPVMAQNLLRTLLIFVETVLMGHVSENALAAMGLCGALIWSLTSLLMVVATGTLATVARSVGANDDEKSRINSSTGLLCGIVLGVVATLIGESLAQPLVRAFVREPEIVSLAVSFLTIVFLAWPFSMMSMVAAAILRGAGDSRTPMWVMALANLYNIVASIVLVFGKLGFPALGIRGAALATASAMVLEGLALFAYLFSSTSRVRISVRSFVQISGDSLRRLWKVSGPGFLEPAAVQSAFLIFTGLVSALGAAAMAAYRLGVAVESLSVLPGTGFEVAAGAVVGQSLGAADPARAERACGITLRYALAVMGSIGLGLILFRRSTAGIFTHNADIVALGVVGLVMVALNQPFKAMAFSYQGALRGAGDTRSTSLVALLGAWIVRVPLAASLIWIFGWGLAGIWTAVVCDWGVRAVLLRHRFQRGDWKQIKL
jgi:MATE family, multidrug efflux pump